MTERVRPMVRSKRDDDRLLSMGEQHLVAETRHSIVKKLAGHDLLEIIKKLRERRDRAREVASGMTSTSRPAPSESDGHRAKRTLLSGALKRANKETERRRATNARSDLISNAKRALAMKKAAHTDARWPPATRTANEDMQPIPNTDIASSGGLKQEGQRSVLERSRKVR